MALDTCQNFFNIYPALRYKLLSSVTTLIFYEDFCHAQRAQNFFHYCLKNTIPAVARVLN